MSRARGKRETVWCQALPAQTRMPGELCTGTSVPCGLALPCISHSVQECRIHRVDHAQDADAALWARPDDVHEEALALIDAVALSWETDAGRPTAAADTALRGRCWIVYMALGRLMVVLAAGPVAWPFPAPQVRCVWSPLGRLPR